MNKLIALAISATTLLSLACNNNRSKSSTTESNDSLKVEDTLLNKIAFQQTIDNKSTDLYILKNKNKMQAAFTNYGGRLVSLMVPDADGKFVDVVVGFKSVTDYKNSTEPYFGATIGRYGNRIAKGKFSIDDKQYSVFTNNGQNALHGGKKGFQYVVFDADQPDDKTLVLTYLSKDMEEGFPGNLKVKVTYSLEDDNSLKMDYEATTDKKTILNLTNHAFFNLNGEGSGTILNHKLQIFSKQYLPVDSTLIPTGTPQKVAGTPFDFTKYYTIGARINDKNDQLKNGSGYDHNYVLDGTKEMGMNHAAMIRGDKTGITMDVYTHEPGLQFYSGNFMQSKNTFKGGKKDDFRTAFCLETQHFPDSPNQPKFPSTTLNPGTTYKTTSIYKFTISK